MSKTTFDPRFDLKTMPLAVQNSMDLWNGTAGASMPDSDNFDEFTRAYSVFGLETVSSEAAETIKSIIEKMEAKKFKLRVAPTDKDKLATLAMEEATKLKEVFKPYAKFGNAVDDKWLKCTETTYAAQAIATWVFNDYAAKMQIKGPSKIKQEIIALENNPDMPTQDKTLAIAELRAKRATEDTGYATFETQSAFIRGIRAMAINVILGADCLSPSKFIVIDTPEGATKVEDIPAEGESRYLAMVIHAATLLNIPLFNIGVEKGRTDLDAFVEKL